MHAPAPHPAPAPPPSVDTSSFLEKLGSEVGGAHKFCYLVTFSRILPDTLVAAAGGLRDAATMSRKQIGANKSKQTATTNTSSATTTTPTTAAKTTP